MLFENKGLDNDTELACVSPFVHASSLFSKCYLLYCVGSHLKATLALNDSNQT